MNNLAVNYSNPGYYDQANDLLVRTLELKRQVFGPEHQSTISSMNSLGLLFDMRGEYAEAERRHREALVICDRALGPDHPLTQQVRTCVAFSVTKQGRYEAASSLAKKAVAAGRATLPENDETTLAAMLIAGMCEEGRGRLPEAESWLRGTVEGIRARQVTKPFLRFHAEARFGLVLGKLGRRAEADTVLQRSFAWVPVWEDETQSILREAISMFDAWHATNPTGNYGKRADELRSLLTQQRRSAT
jgi:tetratricopeptide (TPR) repeat protein